MEDKKLSAGAETDVAEEKSAEEKNSAAQGRGRVHWKSFGMGAAAAAAAIAVACGVYMTLPFGSEPARPGSLAAYRKLLTIQNLIDHNFYGDVDEKAETDTMYLGMVTGLGDKYSTYYTKEQYEQIKMDNNGQMKGIGVSIAQDADSGYLCAQSVMKDSPAEKAGVKKGDLITEILGKDTKGMSASDAVKLIQNSEDDTITLSVIHEGGTEAEKLSMKKDTITRDIVDGALLDGDVGYIRISSFNRQTEPQFSSIYDQLNDKNMKGLIIDLRDDLGGLVDACCDTLNLFMPKGALVYERDKDGNEKHRDSKGENPINIPVVVLVNGDTASASEMFTGAVQDYKVGVVVGTQTYGKGIEQNSYTLSDGSVLKVTTVHYFTPDHNDINGKGITPDVKADLAKDAKTDTQLAKGYEVLRDLMSGTERSEAIENAQKEKAGDGRGADISKMKVEEIEAATESDAAKEK